MKKDIHHHFVPAVLRRYQPDLPAWTVEDSLRFMDERGIDKATLSVAHMNFDFGSTKEYASVCREANQELEDVVRAHPDRFDAFAVLPLPHARESLAELRHCGFAGFAGFVVFSNVGGKYPSTVELEEVFAALDKKGATLFIHPAPTPEVKAIKNGAFSDLVELPQEVPRLISMFLTEDAFKRFPNIQYVLGHGGGTLPFQFARIGKLPYVKTVNGILKLRFGRLIKDLVTKKIMMVEYAKRMTFDLYDSDAPEQVATLRAMANEDQLVYGSNYPYL